MHCVSGAPSSAHLKVVPSSLAVKRNVAIVLDVGFVGPKVMVVSGTSVSAGPWIVQPWSAGPRSTWPVGPTARTAKRCQPTARPEYETPDSQVSNTAPSSAHWKVAPAMSDRKVNDALDD